MSFLAGDALLAVGEDVIAPEVAGVAGSGASVAEAEASAEAQALTEVERVGAGAADVHITVEELGPARLDEIASRALAPQFGARVFEVFAERERSIFESYGGKYVRTGTLEHSLTELSAAGAIRRLFPGGAEFGTSVWYARYQGTTGAGDHAAPSAIVRASELEAAAAATAVGDYILRGQRL